MPQGVTRSNRVLKNISKEFCIILTHWQRRSKSEIAKFKELPGNLLVTCAGPLDCSWGADPGAAAGPGESEFAGAEEGAAGLLQP